MQEQRDELQKIVSLLEQTNRQVKQIQKDTGCMVVTIGVILVMALFLTVILVMNNSRPQ